MKYREFLSLTDDEIRQIVTDIFHPKKITCIKRNKTFQEITCKIYMEWGDPADEDGIYTMADTLTLKDPFKNLSGAISVDFSVLGEDYHRFKQFCFAKGISPWLKDNPYLETETSDSIHLIRCKKCEYAVWYADGTAYCEKWNSEGHTEDGFCDKGSPWDDENAKKDGQ